MPIPTIFRLDPRDLQKNIAIGISLPFNGPAVFNKTFSTKDQVKSNLINFLLTNKGERVMNPNFGSSLKKFLFEFITDDNLDAIRGLIINETSIYIPQIKINNIDITKSIDEHFINISIFYSLKLSGQQDILNLNFE